jgi:hypothetical protein
VGLSAATPVNSGDAAGSQPTKQTSCLSFDHLVIGVQEKAGGASTADFRELCETDGVLSFIVILLGN